MFEKKPKMSPFFGRLILPPKVAQLVKFDNSGHLKDERNLLHKNSRYSDNG
jgi:hypothetical protein